MRIDLFILDLGVSHVSKLIVATRCTDAHVVIKRWVVSRLHYERVRFSGYRHIIIDTSRIETKVLKVSRFNSLNCIDPLKRC